MLNINVTIWPSNSISSFLPRRNEDICPYKDLCVTLTAAAFTIAKEGDTPNIPQWANA